MKQCYLDGDVKNKKTDKEKLCHLACQGGKFAFTKKKNTFICLL